MAKRENTIKIIENTIPEDDTVIETTNDAITDENVSDVQEEIKPLNMEEKITLKNLANWMVGFNKLETNGEVNIKAGGSIRLSRAEVISQFENGNKLLRDKNKVEKIFAIKELDDFKKEVTRTFTTQAEKVLLIKLIRECGFNDFNKIRECEAVCGMAV